MKQNVWITGIYLLAAVVYTLGPHTVFQVCEATGDTVMRCHWSVRAEFGVAILLVGIAVLYAVTKTQRERALLSGIAVVNSLVAILIPSVLIGGCDMKGMECQSVTFPSFYVTAIVVMVASVINILRGLKRGKGLGVI
ncbi:MAG: hypothetical protein H6Q60_755 [Oscillospiraceae bacterium]|nr:hypothetical protein [Oscillospiraceae bacterium]